MKRLVVLLALGVAIPVAHADHPHNKLWSQGVKAFDELDYPKAIDLLTRAVAETLTHDEKRAAYQKLSLCHIAFEDETAAQKDFQDLLGVDPEFRLDNTASPRMRAVFDKAKAQFDLSNPMVEPPNVPPPTVAPPKIEPPRPTPLEVQIDPLRPIAGDALSLRAFAPAAEEKAVSAQLYYRARGQTGWSKIVADGQAGHFSLTVPGMAVAAPGLDYYLVALDAGGGTVAVAGDADHPSSTDVAERPRSHKTAAVALGVTGGVVVVAVAIGLLVALMPHDAAPGTPGTIQVITH